MSIANKAGGAVMPAIGAAVLAGMDYAANGTQIPEVLDMVNRFVTFIPALLSAANGIFYLFYPISTDRHKEILGELIRRREQL